MLARLVDSAPPSAGELPAAPERPVSEHAGQGSRAIIPGDDPGDQQPPTFISQQLVAGMTYQKLSV